LSTLEGDQSKPKFGGLDSDNSPLEPFAPAGSTNPRRSRREHQNWANSRRPAVGFRSISLRRRKLQKFKSPFKPVPVILTLQELTFYVFGQIFQQQSVHFDLCLIVIIVYLYLFSAKIEFYKFIIAFFCILLQI
jgi:hypothetical protein